MEWVFGERDPAHAPQTERLGCVLCPRESTLRGRNEKSPRGSAVRGASAWSPASAQGRSSSHGHKTKGAQAALLPTEHLIPRVPVSSCAFLLHSAVWWTKMCLNLAVFWAGEWEQLNSLLPNKWLHVPLLTLSLSAVSPGEVWIDLQPKLLKICVLGLYLHN